MGLFSSVFGEHDKAYYDREIDKLSIDLAIYKTKLAEAKALLKTDYRRQGQIDTYSRRVAETQEAITKAKIARKNAK